MQRDRVDEPLNPDYNVAPTKPVYAVMTRRSREEAGGSGTSAPHGSEQGSNGQAAGTPAAELRRPASYGSSDGDLSLHGPRTSRSAAG